MIEDLFIIFCGMVIMDIFILIAAAIAKFFNYFEEPEKPCNSNIISLQRVRNLRKKIVSIKNAK